MKSSQWNWRTEGLGQVHMLAGKCMEGRLWKEWKTTCRQSRLSRKEISESLLVPVTLTKSNTIRQAELMYTQGWGEDMHITYQMTELMVVLEPHTEHLLDCSGSQVSWKRSQRDYDFKALPPPKKVSNPSQRRNHLQSETFWYYWIISVFISYPFHPSLIYLPNREHSLSLACLN